MWREGGIGEWMESLRVVVVGGGGRQAASQGARLKQVTKKVRMAVHQEFITSA
jgi:hypothetical protein